MDLPLPDRFKLSDGILNGRRTARFHGTADAAIGGNFKIRVGIAAVLGDIETLQLFLRRYSQPDSFFD